MLDIEQEDLITMEEAAKRLPKSKRGPVHEKTVAKWCRDGVEGVRLESVKIGSRRMTSKEACLRFFSALTNGPEPVQTTVPNSKRSESVKKKLRARGYKT